MTMRTAFLSLAVVLFTAHHSAAQPGFDPALPCGMQPLDSTAACGATGPAPADYVPTPPIPEGEYTPIPPGPNDPPPFTPGFFDPVSRIETILPIPSGYVDYDPGFLDTIPGYVGCMPDPCAPLQKGIIGADTREHITNTTDYPWRAIGAVHVTWANGVSGTGTGALIGPKHLLTCGHNLHNRTIDPANPWCTTMTFYAGETGMLLPPPPVGPPAPNPNARPYRVANYAGVYWWTAWVNNQNPDFDMMLVILDTDIGNTVGWFGRQTGGTDVNRWRQISGYPGDKPRREQWWAGGTVSAETNYLIRYDNDTFRGHSGSPVWYYEGTLGAGGRLIRAVHTGIQGATVANPNRGVLMNRGKYDTISGWIAQNPVNAAFVVAPCDSCGPDCNANGVQDVDDIALGTSQDSNGDGVPDECQADLLEPADQVTCSGPVPDPVPANGMGTVTVTVTRQGSPLNGRQVYFTTPTGNVVFLAGITSPDGMSSAALTDANGEVDMPFNPTATGSATIRAEVAGGAPAAECEFTIQPPTAVSGLASLEAIPGENRIVVSWSVRSREEYRGFFVHRAAGEGQFVLVSPEMIPNAATDYPAVLTWTDESVLEGVDYNYQIEVVNGDGTAEMWDRTVSARVQGRVPTALRLRIVGPNPFGPYETPRFAYDVPLPGAAVTLAIFDTSGRRVATLVEGPVGPGTHEARWDHEVRGRLASGVFLVRMEAGGSRLHQRIVHVK